MKSQGMKEPLFDPSPIQDKMFYMFRKIYPYKGHDELRYHWSSMYNKHWNRHVVDMFKLIRKAGVHEKVYLQRPALYLSLENEFLTWKSMEELDKFYQGGSLLMPKKHLYYRFISHYRKWQEKRLDYIYHTIPWQANTHQYEFPGEYVGQYGVYEATRELLKRDPDSQKLIKDESIYVLRKNNQSYTEHIVTKIRKEFREKNQIPEDGVLLFVNPGNDKAEAEFCLNECKMGVEEFARKYFSPTSLEPRALPKEHLVTFLPIKKGCMKYILNYSNNNQTISWIGRLYQKLLEDTRLANTSDNCRMRKCGASGWSLCISLF